MFHIALEYIFASSVYSTDRNVTFGRAYLLFPSYNPAFKVILSIVLSFYHEKIATRFSVRRIKLHWKSDSVLWLYSFHEIYKIDWIIYFDQFLIFSD